MGHGKKFLPLVFASVLSLALIPLVVDDVFAGVTTPPLPNPTPLLGDFKCYEFPPIPAGWTVDLQDQFHLEVDVDVVEFFKFCANVDKAENLPHYFGSPDVEIPNQHYDVYRIVEPSVDLVAVLTDQFGTVLHDVMNPVELWVPANKIHDFCPDLDNSGFDLPFDPSQGLCVSSEPAGGSGQIIQCGIIGSAPPFSGLGYFVDFAGDGLCKGPPANDNSSPNENFDEIHYKCYNIDEIPFNKPNPVFLNDQFANINPDNLGVSKKLCNPVIKGVVDGPFGPQDPTGVLEADHLKCYEILSPDFLTPVLTLQDQLVDPYHMVLELTEVEFCTVALKILVSTAPIGGTIIPIDTTSLLLVGAQMTAVWLIPVIVAGIGFAIVIARKF